MADVPQNKYRKKAGRIRTLTRRVSSVGRKNPSLHYVVSEQRSVIEMLKRVRNHDMMTKMLEWSAGERDDIADVVRRISIVTHRVQEQICNLELVFGEDLSNSFLNILEREDNLTEMEDEYKEAVVRLGKANADLTKAKAKSKPKQSKVEKLTLETEELSDRLDFMKNEKDTVAREVMQAKNEELRNGFSAVARAVIEFSDQLKALMQEQLFLASQLQEIPDLPYEPYPYEAEPYVPGVSVVDTQEVLDSWQEEDGTAVYYRAKQRIRVEGGTRGVVLRVDINALSVLDPTCEVVYGSYPFTQIKAFKVLGDHCTFAFLKMVGDRKAIFEFVLLKFADLHASVQAYIGQAAIAREKRNRVVRVRRNSLATSSILGAFSSRFGNAQPSAMAASAATVDEALRRASGMLNGASINADGMRSRKGSINGDALEEIGLARSLPQTSPLARKSMENLPRLAVEVNVSLANRSTSNDDLAAVAAGARSPKKATVAIPPGGAGSGSGASNSGTSSNDGSAASSSDGILPWQRPRTPRRRTRPKSIYFGPGGLGTNMADTGVVGFADFEDDGSRSPAGSPTPDGPLGGSLGGYKVDGSVRVQRSATVRRRGSNIEGSVLDRARRNQRSRQRLQAVYEGDEAAAGDGPLASGGESRGSHRVGPTDGAAIFSPSFQPSPRFASRIPSIESLTTGVPEVPPPEVWAQRKARREARLAGRRGRPGRRNLSGQAGGLPTNRSMEERPQRGTMATSRRVAFRARAGSRSSGGGGAGGGTDGDGTGSGGVGSGGGASASSSDRKATFQRQVSDGLLLIP